MHIQFEKWRKPTTMVLAVFWFLGAFVIDSRWKEDSPIGLSLLALGYMFTSIGVLGRIWCLSYIAGRKTEELVVEGPYSLCRNPLYFFSLLGVIGVGLGSSTLIFPLIVFLAFVAYYPGVVTSEARRLAAIHGESFHAYQQSTPALVPSRMHFHESEKQLIDCRAFRRGLFDSIWFFVGLANMHIFAELQHCC